MRWTGAGLSAGTALTTGNVNTTGNGDSVVLGITGTWTATMQADGVLVTGTSGSILRLECTRTSSIYGVGQMFYTPLETPGATLAIYTYRSASAAAGSLVHYSDGRFGFQNAAGATVAGATSGVAAVVGHEYQCDTILVVGTGTTTGRYVHRIKDLTDPTWNTTGEAYYDSAYTINTGASTAAVLTQHRAMKVGNGVLNTGMKARQIGWDTTTISTSTTRSTVETQFMTAPATNVDVAASSAGSGTLVASAVVAVASPVALAGGGTLTATAQLAAATTVGLTGSGQLDATAATAVTVTAPLSGAGTLAASGLINVARTISLTGSGTLTAGTPAVNALTTVGLNGFGATTATAKPNAVTSAGLTGSGTLAAAASTSGNLSESVAPTGVGALTATGVVNMTRSTTLTGDGSLASTAKPAVPATAAHSGAGALAATGSVSVTVAAAFTSVGTLTASATIVLRIETTAALGGGGNLAATAILVAVTTTVELAGDGTLAANGTVGAYVPGHDVTVTILGPYHYPLDITGPYAYPLTILGPTE